MDGLRRRPAPRRRRLPAPREPPARRAGARSPRRRRPGPAAPRRRCSSRRRTSRKPGASPAGRATQREARARADARCRGPRSAPGARPAATAGGVPGGTRHRLRDAGPRVRPARARRARRHRLGRGLVPRRRPAEDLDALDAADPGRLHAAGRRDVHDPAGRQRRRTCASPSRAAPTLLDIAAQRAILNAAPFGPLPKDYGRPTAYTIQARLQADVLGCAIVAVSSAAGSGVAGACAAASRRCRSPQRRRAPAGESTIVIGGGDRPLRRPRLRPAPADEASQAAVPQRSPRCCATTCASRASSSSCPTASCSAIPPLNPDAPELRGLEGHRRRDPGRHPGRGRGRRAHRRGAGLLRGQRGRRCWPSATRARADNPRVFAHQASDDIMTLTQYTGVARTRIAFTSDRDATKERRSKELYIVDYDGFNPRRVTVNGSLNILPAWSPDGRSLAYVSYRQGSPLRLPRLDLRGPERRQPDRRTGDGQAFAPAFSPDGKSIAFASNRSGQPGHLGGERRRQRRRGASPRPPASDTAPCWSPTGQEIALHLEPHGHAADLAHGQRGAQRPPAHQPWATTTTAAPGTRRSSTARSPTPPGSRPGGFDIAVIDLATRQVRQITQGRGSCEYPSWAPNGRHLVFSCNRGGRWQITVADREGRSLQTLATGPGNNVQPDWGP